MNKRQAKKFYKKPEAIPYLKYKHKKAIIDAYKIYSTYFDPERECFRGIRVPTINQKVHAFISYMQTAICLKNKYPRIIVVNLFTITHHSRIMHMEGLYWTLMHAFKDYYNGIDDPLAKLYGVYAPSLTIRNYLKLML